jgi:hypothetical protein
VFSLDISWPRLLTIAIPLLLCSSPLWKEAPSNCEFLLQLSLFTDWISTESSLILRPTVSRPVCLGIKHPSGAYDQFFVTVRQLQVCWSGALSLARGRVCRLQLLLALASAVILGSESRGTRYHILLCEIPKFPFRHLLRLAGLRWRYSTPSTRESEFQLCPLLIISRHGPLRKHSSSVACLSVAAGTCLPRRSLAAAVYSCLLRICCLATDMVPSFVSRPLPRNECCFRVVL